jgi:hypothetical protein
MKILNLYCSCAGNTAKIAMQIGDTCGSLGHEVETFEVVCGSDVNAVDFLDYDFIFSGSGVYSWLPPTHMLDYIGKQNKKHAERGDIQPGSPRLSGKKAVMYCTFGGPHTGVNEAIVAPKYTGQLFDHLGFEIVGEWHFPGEFKAKGYVRYSKDGRMGDITGRPNAHDLATVHEQVCGILMI